MIHDAKKTFPLAQSLKPKVAAPEMMVRSPIFPGHQRPHVTPAEIAQALGITGRQARDLIETDVFARVPIGANPHAQRKHVRVLRHTVEAWWLERYLEVQGEEYPWPNPPEVAMWRIKLRSHSVAATGKVANKNFR